MRVSIALLPLLFGLAACDKQSASTPQPKPAESTAKPTKTFFDESQQGKAAPDAPFTAPDGTTVTLASFKGRPVLVNLWATWCGPCIKEMPGLDRIAAQGKDKLTVLTVNQMDETKALKAWWAARKLANLAPYADPDGKLGFAFETGMLPTTILYDAAGKEVWRVVGSMDWDSAEARAKLSTLL